MRRSLSILYLVLNLAGALVVAVAAHRVSAVIAAEGRTTSDSVDGVTFFVHALPGFLVGLVANAAWAAWALVDAVRRRRYSTGGVAGRGGGGLGGDGARRATGLVLTAGRCAGDQ